MKLEISCPHCGQSLEAEDEMIGMQCECPNCAKEITIIAPSDTAGNPKCPDCQSEMDAEAVICMNCGFNNSTGKKLVLNNKPSPGTHEAELSKEDLKRSKCRKVLLPSAVFWGFLLGGLFCFFLFNLIFPFYVWININITISVVAAILFIPLTYITVHLANRQLDIHSPWWAMLIPGPYLYCVFKTLKIWAETYIYPKSINSLRLVAAGTSAIIGIASFIVAVEVIMDTGHHAYKPAFGVLMFMGILLIAEMFLLIFRKNLIAVIGYGIALLCPPISFLMGESWGAGLSIWILILSGFAIFAISRK